MKKEILNDSKFWAKLIEVHNKNFNVTLGKKTCDKRPESNCGCVACQEMIGGFDFDINYVETYLAK